MSCSHLIRWFTGWLSFVHRCLLQLRNWLKPNFSSYWGNWFLAPLFAFFLGFLPITAFAEQVWELTYNKVENVTPSDPVYSSADEACSASSGYDYAGPLQTSSFGTTYAQCLRLDNQGNEVGGLYLAVLISTTCPDPGTLYSGELIGSSVGSGFTDPDGCPVVPNYKPTYCDYPGAEDQECVMLDGYKYGDSAPPEPKSCRDSTGRYIGQVSGNASCPDVQKTKCYNPDGTLAYTADSPSQCPDNTSPDNSPDNPDNPNSPDNPDNPDNDPDEPKTCTTETESSSVENADGSVTVTNTTTESCSDGSGSTRTTTRTTQPDGTTTETEESTETEADKPTVTGGNTCDVEPSCDGDPLQCYQIKQQWRDSCHKNESIQGFNCADPDAFQCSGGPIECYSLKLQHVAACVRGDKSAAEQAVSDAIASGDIDFDGTDDWGQLNGLNNGEFNVSDSFNLGAIWTDSGAAGSCPAPIAISTNVASFEFSFQPMCDLAGMIRALVILSAMWISGSMVAQTLAGTRYTV